MERQNPRRFARYALIIGLAGLVALVWTSMLSYSPTDPPARWDWPPKSPIDNHAGIVGAHIAHFLRF